MVFEAQYILLAVASRLIGGVLHVGISLARLNVIIGGLDSLKSIGPNNSHSSFDLGIFGLEKSLDDANV